MVQGFILEPAFRLENGRPVVHLWGALETGESFLVRDRRAEPSFFVAAADAAAARSLGAARIVPTALRTMDGAPVVEVRSTTPREASALAERLEVAGVLTHEADVPFVTQYLIDRGLRGAVSIEGEHVRGHGVDRAYLDPELAPASLEAELRCLSLDIETDPEARRVLSVALHSPDVAEVLVAGGGGGPPPAFARVLRGERELLEELVHRVRAIDPDVLTGWNVVSFDLAVLERRARELSVRLALGRGPASLRVTASRNPWWTSRAQAEGRAVLDGIDLLRGAFVRVQDHRLDTVARAILGEGKTISAPGRAHERAHAIERLFREDLAAFCAYNLRDAELVTRLLERAGLVKLAVKRSLLTGMPLPRVSASIASLDALYLPELHARGHVAPSVRAAREEAEPTEGGAVLAPVAGLHERVLVFDFKSLYPSIMRTFNVDPFTHVRAPAPGQDVIRTPSGACFSREGGILPSLLGRLMAVREDARRRGDAAASQATKVLMSSFYGVLATPACRFHESALANAITQAGQALLRWTKARAEALGHRVLYGDTDSLFVESGAAADEEAQAVGRALVRRLNDDLRAHLAKEHGVDSRLELELEGLHVKLFLPRVRGGAEGARKRYAGLFDDGTRREVVFVGMESARRDATAAAKLLQRGLYERLFAGRPVEAFARDFVRAVRAGEHDEALVYRKALRKDAAGYTATTPPHVRAARLEGRRGRGLVEYVMTVAGPEPLGAVEHAIDHEHYVEKQLRPVVEPLLDLLCLDWDDLVGRPRQLELF